MAEAFAKIHGKGVVEPFSAGSSPSGKVNVKAVHAMKLHGYDMSDHTSKSVDDLGDMEFDYVIGMGCGDACPYVKTKHRIDWEIPDPRNFEGDAFLQIRDKVEQLVLEFIESI